MTAEPIFTIGHSNRTLEAFLALLHGEQVAAVVDVRSAPSSRKWPHFDGPALAAALNADGMDYRHAPDLGGHRPASHLPPEVNGYWQHAGFHNYADYAMGEPFAAALQRLLTESSDRRSAVMCAEAVWWRCHRRIIADYLLARGRRVRHILSATQTVDATPTPAARPQADGRVAYPPSADDQGASR
ncbi:MAG TPA: DUF488 domain-containing protein [Rhodanobacteraceae bacterium]|nr:DUF488 domain-containing protein [Rhodanobacteraceae bacterium]